MIKKTITKNRLLNPILQKFAKQECLFHSYMEHKNVVRLIEYTETDEEYIMFVEFCDRANHLQRKILDVIYIIAKMNI